MILEPDIYEYYFSLYHRVLDLLFFIVSNNVLRRHPIYYLVSLIIYQ